MITLNCKDCDFPMTSKWYEPDDIVICESCWGYEE